MKNALLVLILFVVGACSACSTRGYEFKQPAKSVVIERALASSVTLYDMENHMVCAGHRIRADFVLTAYHCVVAASFSYKTLEAMDKLGVELNDVVVDDVLGRIVKFRSYSQVLDDEAGGPGTSTQIGMVVAGNAGRDVAILKTPPTGQATVELSVDALPVGAEVFSIGHPMGLSFTYSKGYISTMCRKDRGVGEGCWIQSDITIWGGSSGGGLFDEAGRLVGVASARPATTFGAGPMIGFFAPADEVLALLPL